MYETMVIAWRNIWRNKRRTALCVFAVSVAVFFNILMDSMIQGMVGGIEEVVRVYDTGTVAITDPLYEADKEYFPVQYPLLGGESASSLVSRVEAIPGVRAALPRVMAYASLFDSTVKHALVWGIDTVREREVNDFNLTDRSDGLVEGRYPEPGKNECMIGTALARKASLKVGDSVPLKLVSAQFSDKYWSPTVSGIFEFDYQRFDEETIVVPIDRLQRILGLGEGTQQLLAFAYDARDSQKIRDALVAEFGKAAVVREWTENYWVAMLKSMNGLYVIVFAVFQIVASFLIINTMLMIIHERVKEIGMMGALGMTRREIVQVFFLEAVFLSVLGAAAGAIIGGLSAFVGSLFPLDLNTFTGGGMKELPMSGTFVLAFSVPAVVKGFFFGIFVSAACTLFPSMKSAFVEPVEALRR